MGDEEPKVITAQKTEKVKDPRGVELGKRLGAISKEAKARKARERQEQQQQQQQRESETSSYLLLVPVIVIGGAVAFGGYRYWFKGNVKEEEPVKEENSIRKEDNRIPRLERLQVSNK